MIYHSSFKHLVTKATSFLFLRTVKEHLISFRTCKIREGRLFNIDECSRERQKALLQVLGQSEVNNKSFLESQIPGKDNLAMFVFFIAECRQWITMLAPSVVIS